MLCSIKAKHTLDIKLNIKLKKSAVREHFTPSDDKKKVWFKVSVPRCQDDYTVSGTSNHLYAFSVYYMVKNIN